MICAKNTALCGVFCTYFKEMGNFNKIVIAFLPAIVYNNKQEHWLRCARGKLAHLCGVFPIFQKTIGRECINYGDFSGKQDS